MSIRMASSFESSVHGSWRIRETAMMGSALLAALSPPRFRRCRIVLPENAGTGLTPQSAAKLAADVGRPGLSPAVTETFDGIIIGGGWAGPALAGRLAGAGRRVAVVDMRHLGGPCNNTGCRPTKAMIATARVAAIARRGAECGVSTGPVSVNMRAVLARVRGIVLEGRQGPVDWLAGLLNVTLIEGHARFLRAVRDRDRSAAADGRAGFHQRRRTAGSSGPVRRRRGAHAAQAFRRFGTRVRVVERVPG